MNEEAARYETAIHWGRWFHGSENGEAYDARIYIRGKFLWVEWKVGRFMTRSCPYSSTKAFAQNWDLAYTT